MQPVEDWEYKVLLGIVWSSLTRYYFFLTASKWGMWHFGIHKNEFLNLPIIKPQNDLLRTTICDIVEQLRAWNPLTQSILRPEGELPEAITARKASLEYELDEAVFDLYRLTESERDLVRDMCEIGIEFFYKSSASEAGQPVTGSASLSSGLYDELPA